MEGNGYRRGTGIPLGRGMATRIRTRPDAGYSLVELLVVLLLVGLLATLAGPSLTGYVNRQKTRGALDRIAADLALARMSAVRTGHRSVVRFSGASGYRVEVEVAGGDESLRRVELGKDYAGVVVLPPASAFEFNSRGLLATAPGSGIVVVSLGGSRDSLMITPAGRIYRDF